LLLPPSDLLIYDVIFQLVHLLDMQHLVSKSLFEVFHSGLDFPYQFDEIGVIMGVGKVDFLGK
jgi:hypothetical protein